MSVLALRVCLFIVYLLGSLFYRAKGEDVAHPAAGKTLLHTLKGILLGRHY